MKTLRIFFLILGVFVLNSCGNPNAPVLEGLPAKLTVRVVNQSSGQPIPNARVSLKKDSQPISGDQASGADGSVVFPVKTGDGYKAFAGNVAGFSPGASPSIKLTGDQEVQILMTPSVNQGAGLVAGSVKDASTQAPLASVTVTLNSGGGVAAQRAGRAVQAQRVATPYRIMQAGVAVQTDQSGQFTFKDVPPGMYQASYQLNGYQTVTRDVTVNPGDSTAIETVFMSNGVGGNTPTNPSNPSTPGNPATRGQLLLVEAGRALQLSAQSPQPVWRYLSSGISGATRLPDGNTVVSDEQLHQVWVIGPTGEVVWNMGTSIGLFSRLSAPAWVAAARDGKSFLIADSGNNRIVEIENNAAGWRFEQGLMKPRSATYASNGNVLIADTGNRRVIEVNRTGQTVWTYSGASLSAPVHAVRLDDGNTLITDAGFNRVIMINPNGQPVWYFDEGLNRPRSAIPTRFGTYLIADTGNNRLIEVDRQKIVSNNITASRPLAGERL